MKNDIIKKVMIGVLITLTLATIYSFKDYFITINNGAENGNNAMEQVLILKGRVDTLGNSFIKITHKLDLFEQKYNIHRENDQDQLKEIKELILNIKK